MRLVLSIVFVALALGWNGAMAQSRADLERCRAIEDDVTRLHCYDAIDLVPSGPLSKYEPVDLTELKAFALSYRGDLVAVTGWVVPGKEFFALGVDQADERPIPIDFGTLSRRDRQAFLDVCGDGCRATVQGTVRPVDFKTGIVADALLVN